MMRLSAAPWLRKRLPAGGEVERVCSILRRGGVRTVCQSAHCPNIFECFARGTATLLILGPNCTRRCRFCAVPKAEPTAVDPEEPIRVAEAVRAMGLDYVVVTSVTRDDLPDGGARAFARVVAEVRERTGARVEVLTPDFAGNWGALAAVVAARPEVYNHNVETVPRLYERVRPGASFERSLRLLERVKELDPEMVTKSGLMVGLGENRAEVSGVLTRLLRVGCDLVTVGQYLAPSQKHLPVARYVPPVEFESMEQEARALGFRGVSAGPFVRSSHGAAELFGGLGGCDGSRVSDRETREGTMRLEVKVPDPGEDGPKEASISFWMFEEGDDVSKGEELVELVTDKASYTVEAPASGRLVKVNPGEGDKVTPGDVLAVIESDE